MTRARALLLAAVLLLALACPLLSYRPVARAQESCTATIAPGQPVQTALDVLQPGQMLCLRGGFYNIPRPGLYAWRHPELTSTHGTAERPFTVQAYPGEEPVLRGWSQTSGRLLQVSGDYWRFLNIDLDGANNLLWNQSGSHNVYEGARYTNGGGECVRFKLDSQRNVFRDNEIERCGIDGFDLSAGHKNGEGVYTGTADDQWCKNRGDPDARVSASNECSSPVPDATNHNLFEGNRIETRASESLEFKEGATGNIARSNTGAGNYDPDGAVFTSRGDGNRFEGNTATGSDGAGFRTGGDTALGRTYGRGNIFRSNRVGAGVKGYGYKLMRSPQDFDCSNTGAGAMGKIKFGEATFSIPCPSPAPSPSPSPRPVPSAPPSPAPDPLACSVATLGGRQYRLVPIDRTCP